MSLLKSASTIAGSSIISQLIGALSIWLISHKYDMAEVGLYALNYSIAVVGAQVCTFASQLLIPKQQDDSLAQNVVFCLLQSTLIALPYAVLTAWLFHQNILFLYLLTLSTAWALISENLSLRTANFYFLIFQRISVSVVVVLSVLLTHQVQTFYWSWACAMILLTSSCILHSFDIRSVTSGHLHPLNNWRFFKQNIHHISKVGSAEVLAMASSNLPIMLINFWFSALTAGYFSVVSRFCLAPVVIIGNAVRNTIFSKWSIDFRNNTFNYQEYTKVRLLLLVLGVVCTLGVFIFYPIVMRLGFSEDWINSIETSRYMLPYLFPALAISPLTVIELIFGSHRYFLRIQLEQLAIVLVAFVVVPYLYKDYATSVILFSALTFIRYGFIYFKMNQRANLLKDKPVIL
ncbi:capsular biosynthesis protein [Citrobacter freundii]|jgi:O-antigen/teichoic acid export membrane protein|uniref:Putative O-antigen transporter n=1 Tax=Citrobacter freundii TaxID=546 RepID=A0ABD7AUW6_CITFR|nr:capsular biosynthesis protein [Citrobacter freundii]QLR72034.1 capsular biosynthesis protein [Citrobacter freundii]QLX24276.1 capsular biosynthesis protein [Citrobacter freundii]QLY35927.1 capsular biosynthesis protein [Citrobacter freundii]QLY51233.1 capsular biosynthesis protein [Citrobacter freundii]QMA46146.1 capsular biosynthesis protein [Citrobacter freundii]